MPQCLFPRSAGCCVVQFPSNGVPSGEAPAQAIVVPIPWGVPLYVCFIEPTWIPIGHCVRPFLRTLSDRTLPRTGGDSERVSFVGRQLYRSSGLRCSVFACGICLLRKVLLTCVTMHYEQIVHEGRVPRGRGSPRRCAWVDSLGHHTAVRGVYGCRATPGLSGTT